MPIINATDAAAGVYDDQIAGRRCSDCGRPFDSSSRRFPIGEGDRLNRCLACNEIAGYPGREFFGHRHGARRGDSWVDRFRGVEVLVRAQEDTHGDRPRVKIERAFPRNTHG